ncbi:hypothetical protein LSAT2_031341 [Lamellibrachia satsuma]|nr:hypothetical protein LSAT2_031341 [Lamellibrachia satsuma]
MPVSRLASSTAPSAVGFNDYDEGLKNFSLEIPEHFNFVTDVIEKWAEIQVREEQEEGIDESGVVNPKHLALWWTSEQRPKIQLQWTFKQLAEVTKRTAYILTGPGGLKPGDRVVVTTSLLAQFWTVQMACIKTEGDGRSGATSVVTSGATDRMLIPKTIKGCIKNCRMHRGTLKDSDHALVVTTLRVGLCQGKPPQGPQRITRVLRHEETASKVSKALAAAVGETEADWADV